jgi:ribosomal protein S18 acetylase RimI-like enzyme
VVLREGHAAGVGLIARRGWTSRLAAMAVVPEARRAGVGSWLLEHLLRQARARRERAMVLEVIEGNEPAVALYTSHGFQTVRRLVSYTAQGNAAPGAAPETEVPTEQIDVREMARWVSAYGLPDLPWQVSGESLSHLGPPSVAYHLDGAYIALSDPDADVIAVRSLLVLPPARGQGRASRLLRATMARHPHKAWRVPPFCPEELGGLFGQAGFARDSLSQLQMAAALA